MAISLASAWAAGNFFVLDHTAHEANAVRFFRVDKPPVIARFDCVGESNNQRQKPVPPPLIAEGHGGGRLAHAGTVRGDASIVMEAVGEA